MKLIHFTNDTIEVHLDDCLSLQKHLVKPEEIPDVARFRHTASDQNNYFIGYIIDDHVVALGEVTKLINPAHTIGYINNIVVDPAHRGKGIFSMLMDELEAKAQEWKCDRTNLTCSRSEVQSLYEKRGYVKRDTHFYMRNVTQ